MKNTIVLVVVAACTAFAHCATEKVPMKSGWRFVKADDPSVGTNMTMQAMSDILDRAERGDLADAPAFDWAKSPYGRSESKGLSTPQSCGTRTFLHAESSNSGFVHAKSGRAVSP